MRTTTLLAHLSAITSVLAASFPSPISTERSSGQNPLRGSDDRQHVETPATVPTGLDDVLKALHRMQGTYYDISAGTWPDAIDWTAAVMGTHVSATLASIVMGLSQAEDNQTRSSCTDLLGLENSINKYFAQLSIFYFAENALGLRQQAYDDMLWVVLGWLENIKFSEMFATTNLRVGSLYEVDWHGLQVAPLAAHRARIFYELANRGWDAELCHGGMVWNPRLEPYKNAITNELFAAASIAMYLYFPGDNNTSPFVAGALSKPHDPVQLENAIKTYTWLKEVGLTNGAGLYQDGYHVTGWYRYRNGTIDPGTRECDSLDKMVYTYNQGVILSASRGLWLATGRAQYLEDGHELIQNVIKATGWPHRDRRWKGLGRAGIMEEFCDHQTSCSQDGQTFKGIFFHHLAEFCRPLWSAEKDMATRLPSTAGFNSDVYAIHMQTCAEYGAWIEHNADAALQTRNDEGLFGMWWGISAGASRDDVRYTEGPTELPDGAYDHRNPSPRVLSHSEAADPNDRGRGRTVETQSGGLAVLRAKWQWQFVFR